MKAEAKRQYIDALVEHARRKTRSASWPVVVHAYRFFAEACDRYSGNQALFHSYDPGDVKRIIDRFDSEFRKAAFSGEGDGLPIHVIPVAKGALALCGHGKQAVIDDGDRTSQAYAAACTISGSNGKQCWALFGPDASPKHPMISGTLMTEKKRINTSVSNYHDKTSWVQDEMVRLEPPSPDLIEQ